MMPITQSALNRLKQGAFAATAHQQRLGTKKCLLRINNEYIGLEASLIFGSCQSQTRH